jgi:hypothetical protein
MTGRPLQQRNQETITKLLRQHVDKHKSEYPSDFDSSFEMNDASTENALYNKGVENIGNLAAGIIGELGSKAIRSFVNKYIGLLKNMIKTVSFPEMKAEIVKGAVYNTDHNLLLALNNMIINELDTRNPGIIDSFLKENPDNITYFPQQMYAPAPWMKALPESTSTEPGEPTDKEPTVPNASGDIQTSDNGSQKGGCNPNIPPYSTNGNDILPMCHLLNHHLQYIIDQMKEHKLAEMVPWSDQERMKGGSKRSRTKRSRTKRSRTKRSRTKRSRTKRSRTKRSRPNKNR